MYISIPMISVKFLEGVVIEATFLDGKIMRYDMAKMFDKYPNLKELESNRRLFESGYIDIDGLGLIWNDDLDFEAESIYYEGWQVGRTSTTLNQQIAYRIIKLREESGLTQFQLAKLTGIDQGDICKLERAQGNPTLKKINKILDALNAYADVRFIKKKDTD